MSLYEKGDKALRHSALVMELTPLFFLFFCFCEDPLEFFNFKFDLDRYVPKGTMDSVIGLIREEKRGMVTSLKL